MSAKSSNEMNNLKHEAVSLADADLELDRQGCITEDSHKRPRICIHLKLSPVSTYSRLPLSRTLRGPGKKFEIAGSSR